MKFSALTFAIAAAASASSVSAFGATRSSAFVATSKAGVSKRRTQMNSSEDLESIPGSLPTIITDSADDAECATPAFERSKSSPLAIEAVPLGIKLHGGDKLRAEGLTGKGVKVAVIDSGVAAGHPDFDGQVVQQTWLRRGGSLMRDDHGTHVAGTIQ
jgi:subtilisin family serine protease